MPLGLMSLDPGKIVLHINILVFVFLNRIANQPASTMPTPIVQAPHPALVRSPRHS
ncbi:hypothetical protein FRB90_003837 [Tulasnella sp. 427]|nr:hypothetical protein FRB90_003837 [Tulasnella sp. 427]